VRDRSVIRRAAAVVAVAWILAAIAAGPTLAVSLPPTEPGRYVYDLAGIWTQATEGQANAQISTIRDRTQAQIAVVSWPSNLGSVNEALARSDAIRIMDTWGVGRAGVNDGLVILFDMDRTLQHGQIYLYGGKGFVASYLTPDEAAEITNGTMLPRAREGNFDAALLDGLARVDHVVQAGGNPDRAGQTVLHALLIGLIGGGALLVGALFVRTWWQRGRDARIPTIDDSVLLPAPPPALTPALAAVLRRDEVDNEAFTAALVDLGHRNLVAFAEHSGFLAGHKVDLVIPDPSTTDAAATDARQRPLGSAESQLARSIEAKATDGVLSASDLKGGEGKKLFDSFKSSIGRAAVASGWFRDDPTKITGLWVGVGIGVIVAAAVVFFLFAMDTSEDSSVLIRAGADYLVAPIGVAVLVGIAILIGQRWLVARTESGAQTLAMALAYRNTLRYEIKNARTIGQAVERTTSRLPWITTPDELTVWAVALGLKSEVDHLIKETFREDPQGGGWAPIWFVGTSGFGSIGDVGSMLSSISTTSASSSGGGYGGGSSGGGGGAGGGF
jgi:uncharacterized membrane protein YgcG